LKKSPTRLWLPGRWSTNRLPPSPDDANGTNSLSHQVLSAAPNTLAIAEQVTSQSSAIWSTGMGS
jgi:hypothetical protein